jgi:hypothetical protein
MKSTTQTNQTQASDAKAMGKVLKATRRWKRLFIGAGTLLVAMALVATAAVTSTMSSSKGMKGDIYSFDESTFTMTSSGMDLQAASITAAGGSAGAAVEMAVTPYAAANTALDAGDWFYKVQVVEASVAVVVTGAYQVELFQDGVSKGALHMTQVSADASAVEGASFKWSLGASLPANAAYVVKVTAE